LIEASNPGDAVVAMGDPGVEWLLSSEDPSIRFLTLTEVLGATSRSAAVRAARDDILEGPKVSALFGGQRPDGGFGIHPYGKWNGAHWRLVSLVELAVPPGEPRAMAALEQVLGWVAAPGRWRGRPPVNGRFRRCASQEGNALAVACRLGAGSEPRLAGIAEKLTTWQWPDGGWNCDVRPEATHSSFNESLATLWGLVEHHRATGEPRSLEAAERTSEFFLRHRVFRSERTGEAVHPEVVNLHYPPYWHFDLLQGLLVLGRAGKLGDSRATGALDLLEAKRLPDGRWPVTGRRYWRLGAARSGREVVDWGSAGPNEMVTLNALRVLAMADRMPR
jgi:hypothetical protein